MPVLNRDGSIAGAGLVGQGAVFPPVTAAARGRRRRAASILKPKGASHG
jgi:hypothetical protein